MALEVTVIVLALALVGWLAAWMLSQKPVTSAQQLIQARRYEDALAAARPEEHLHRAEALKLLGRFDEAIAEYRRSDDPAAMEGIALALARQGRDLDEAKRLMEESIARYPQIQEFQALALAYVLLRRGEHDAALRVYHDNLELLETRFRDDYTDPDPLLAETLLLFSELARADGDVVRSDALGEQARLWRGATMTA
jgi:tetratricopeptide (TPR) repeat protein